MTERNIELLILLGAFILAQWPLFVFANTVSADEFVKSASSLGSGMAILGAYKLFHHFHKG